MTVSNSLAGGPPVLRTRISVVLFFSMKFFTLLKSDVSSSFFDVGTTSHPIYFNPSLIALPIPLDPPITIVFTM